MFEIKHTVHMPDLLPAITALAKLIQGSIYEVQPHEAFIPASVPEPTPTTASVVQAQTFVTEIPAAAPVPPTTAAPQYTIEAIANTGASLVQAGKMAQLQGLLQQFNIQAVTQLPQEQYGAFATALRGLGAQI